MFPPADKVPEGLDLAVMKMKEGERALVTVPASYGYGDAGAPAGGEAGLLAAVPPGAPLTYEVTLVTFANAKESWEMSDVEKVDDAAAKKDKVGERAGGRA
jgi:FK506-binding protein 4/5